MGPRSGDPEWRLACRWKGRRAAHPGPPAVPRGEAPASQAGVTRVGAGPRGDQAPTAALFVVAVCQVWRQRRPRLHGGAQHRRGVLRRAGLPARRGRAQRAWACIGANRRGPPAVRVLYGRVSGDAVHVTECVVSDLVGATRSTPADAQQQTVGTPWRGALGMARQTGTRHPLPLPATAPCYRLIVGVCQRLIVSPGTVPVRWRPFPR